MLIMVYESQSISIVYMFYIYVYTRNVKKDTLSEELSGILTGEVVSMLLNRNKMYCSEALYSVRELHKSD